MKINFRICRPYGAGDLFGDCFYKDVTPTAFEIGVSVPFEYDPQSREKMTLNMEMQLAWSDAARLGVRREAKRHAAFVRAGRVECSGRFVRAKAVSPLRSATAVQDAGAMKKLIEIRSSVRK